MTSASSVFSVIIPTFNNCRILPEVLDALEAQVGAPAFEIIVVNDGSSDGTREFLEKRHFRRPAATYEVHPYPVLFLAHSSRWLRTVCALLRWSDAANRREIREEPQCAFPVDLRVSATEADVTHIEKKAR